MAKKEEPTFEEGAKQLKEIISQLENDDLELDEAIDLFSRGIENLAFCKEKLARIKAKITELKQGKNGKLAEEILDFDA
jgi:exodeoxyribonuclease VII small subunit